MTRFGIVFTRLGYVDAIGAAVEFLVGEHKYLASGVIR